MDGDGEWDILAKLLQLENAEAGNLTQSNAANAYYASQAVVAAAAQNFYAAQALANSQALAELQQKTEPSDAQLVRGSMAVVSAEFTRPADTTAYAINDVVGPHTTPAVMTFTNIARIADGTGYITNVRLVKSRALATNALFRLWLYGTAIAAIADNSPFTLLFANKSNRLGYVDLVCTTEGAGSDSASAFIANVNLKFACTGGSRNIYGVLEAKQAYAPDANSEQFFVELTASQN